MAEAHDRLGWSERAPRASAMPGLRYTQLQWVAVRHGGTVLGRPCRWRCTFERSVEAAAEDAAAAEEAEVLMLVLALVGVVEAFVVVRV